MLQSYNFSPSANSNYISLYAKKCRFTSNFVEYPPCMCKITFKKTLFKKIQLFLNKLLTFCANKGMIILRRNIF